MQIATWNVNSIRARMPVLVDWLKRRQPDVVCLQETKVEDDKFPREPLEELGYHVEALGQKTYNGVAILARDRIEDVVRGFPGDGGESERRVLGATIGDVMVLNLYVVNGQSVGSDRYGYKLEWLERLHDFVHGHYDMREKVILLGDFNITFDDRDVYDPVAWRGKVLCSEPERDGLAALLSCGLKDGFRQFHEEGGHYTWWDFRTRGFSRNRGLRIDHLLMSPPAVEACTGVEIDVEARAVEKPSDHAPVIATLRG